MRYGFLLLAFLFTGSAFALSTDSTALNYDTIISNVTAAQTEYNTFAGRARLTYDDGTSQQDFQATIRMQKDSIVWMSLTGAFGIEGARILITPDTFRIINRLQGEYTVRDFNYVGTWLLFPISFKMLQQVITGERIDIPRRASFAGMEDSAIVLYCESDKMLEKIWVNNRNYTIEKMLLKDKMLSQAMTVTFDAYNSVNGKAFSNKRSIQIDRAGLSLKLDIDFVKTHLNDDQTYPFEVSDKLLKHSEDH